MSEKSQLEKACFRLGIKADALLVGAEPNPDFPDSFAWRVRLRFQGRSFSTDFYCGKAHVIKPWDGSAPVPKPPSAADVLSCLCSDVRSAEDNAFEGWCSELGYDVDSRKGEKVYRACEKLAPKLRIFLGDAFDEIAMAEH